MGAQNGRASPALATAFGGVSRPALEAIRSEARLRVLRRGEFAFRTGDPVDRVFIVERGSLKISSADAEGGESVVALLGAGDVAGDLGGERQTHDGRAVELTHVSTVAIGDLRSVLGEVATVRVLNRLLAERLRHTSTALAVVLRGDIQQRIASRLCDLATRHGRLVGGGTRLAVRITQEDLARMTGSSRETVNKTIARFTRRGWMTNSGGRYVLRDIVAMRRFAGV